jgi:hypothetical protein
MPRVLIEFDPLSETFTTTTGRELEELFVAPDSSPSPVPIPPNYVPDTPVGLALADIWRANYEGGVGFERAVMWNWTYMGPIVANLFNQYPESRVMDIWPAARVGLREYFVERLTLRPVVTRIPIGNKLYACRVFIGTNPGATIYRWLDDPSMAPTIDAPNTSLLDDIRRVSPDRDYDCLDGVEVQSTSMALTSFASSDPDRSGLDGDDALYYPCSPIESLLSD